MGGDGGQVIDRATMVKTKGWGLTKSAGGRYAASLGEMANYVQMVSEDTGMTTYEMRKHRMSSCWLSQEPLRDPVVACRLGNLYNKEALINALLSGSMPKQLEHVRALKDVKQCQLTWKEAEQEGGLRRMVCPVSREDLDTGGSRAVVIWTTGAVLSAKTLKELKLKECPVTGKAFDPDKDVVPLIPDGPELEKLRERLPAAKKRKAAAAVTGEAPADSSSSTGPKVTSSTRRYVNDVAQAETWEASASSTASAVGAERKRPVTAKLEEGVQKGAKNGLLEPPKSDAYRSMFNKSSGDGNGMTGTRDAFGTPCYNRGQK
mmetsp:Transcript_1375/g.3022  ORF Transcript_1375/g.3022 Transcript_1375/m.3022 type:complete len:319 (+) Transcript_1375:125-1081(+)